MCVSGTILVYYLTVKILKTFLEKDGHKQISPPVTMFFSITTLLIDNFLLPPTSTSHHDIKCPGSQLNFLHREFIFPPLVYISYDSHFLIHIFDLQ